MSRWTWSDCYDGARIITLVLDEDEAEAFVDEARRDGRLIAANTVRGLPAPAKPAVARPRPPIDPADLEGWHALGRKIEAEALPSLTPPAPPAPITAPAPFAAAVIPRIAESLPKLPAPDPKPLPRPQGAPPPMIPVKRRDPDLQTMVEAAIAAGKLTVCPPCKHSVEPGQMLPGEGNWKQRKAAKEKRRPASEPREDAP